VRLLPIPWVFHCINKVGGWGIAVDNTVTVPGASCSGAEAMAVNSLLSCAHRSVARLSHSPGSSSHSDVTEEGEGGDAEKKTCRKTV